MRKSLILVMVLMCVVLIPMALTAKESITFWLMPNAPDETHIPWLEEKAKEFEAQTGYKVNFEIIGWGEAWQKISVALASQSGPDVFQVGTTWNPQFAATGGLEKIDIAEFGGKEAFMEANYISTTYKGESYGVPWFAETRCLFYNKEMFSEAGVQPPNTYEELKAVGKKIVEKFGEGSAIAIAGTNAWDLLHNWAIVLWAYGGNLLTPDNKKAAFNDEAGIEAMKWYASLIVEGLAAKACAEYNQPQADAAFINGNVAMCFMGPWNIAGIEQENPDLPYDVVEPPAGPVKRASFSGGSNLVILKGSPNKDAAKEWIKFLLSKENLVDYTKNLSHMLPAKIEAFEDPYYDTGVWKVFKKTLGYATAYPPLAVWGDIENAVVQEFRNILTAVASGEYSEETVKMYLDKAAERVNQALAKER
ncbi:sugar ABC transporter substrate-binding protein [Atrimonas thermophila]|jgi:multiple sugar transport system substrate-binding protein|uniref:sugar ABC transporter substrate-binding protein n=1 Tax=Atrimonas thermophila TaxID=3064161 RepID=UPI00399CF971